MHQHKNGPYDLYTKIDHWDVEQDRLMNDYFIKRSQIVLDQLREVGLAGEIITGNETDIRTSYDAAKVSPMPFSHQVNIKFNLNRPGSAELLIYSGAGKVRYYKQTNYLTTGRKQFSWKPDNESGGVYFYRIRTTDITYSGKLVYIQ
jgi:protoporphyrinogen oxidase